MTIAAERLEVRQVMNATELAMAPARALDVIDFKPFGFARFTIGAHRHFEFRFIWEAHAARTPRCLLAALRASIFVAPLCRAARQRPPMVIPKRIAARIAAPGAAARR